MLDSARGSVRRAIYSLTFFEYLSPTNQDPCSISPCTEKEIIETIKTLRLTNQQDQIAFLQKSEDYLKMIYPNIFQPFLIYHLALEYLSRFTKDSKLEYSNYRPISLLYNVLNKCV